MRATNLENQDESDFPIKTLGEILQGDLIIQFKGILVIAHNMRQIVEITDLLLGVLYCNYSKIKQIIVENRDLVSKHI